MEKQVSGIPSGQSQPPQNILVVGDWVVDEHWVIGVHRSPTSSRIGREHYRALHPLRATVESLCAAGRTASVLDQARCGSNKFCEVIGLGLWHDSDTWALTRLLDPVGDNPHSPHQMTRQAENVRRERLYNLGRVLTGCGHGQLECGTTRMIRIYQHTGSKFELLERIDWELPVHRPHQDPGRLHPRSKSPEGEPVLFGCREEISDSRLDEFMSQYRDNVRAVVIKDVRKGVVCDAMIEWLASQFKDLPWFVSTKSWKPAWFKKLESVNVRLLVIPQMAAQWAIKSGELNRWITSSGDASSAALKIMDILGRAYGNALVVALPADLQVLVRGIAQHDGERLGYLQIEKGPPQLAVGLPMASVFFAALIANLMARQDGSLDLVLSDSLRFTHKWMSIELGRVDNPQTWMPSQDQVLEVSPCCAMDEAGSAPQAPATHGRTIRGTEEQLNGATVRAFEGDWKAFNWQQGIRDWGNAFSEYGIIEFQGKKRLELWRCMTEVDGYVCCVKARRALLQMVFSELASFHRREEEPKSCMFIASPGSGKTFLVRKLAESLSLRYLGFNITQMISKNDLLDCFDTIVTNQAQNKDESFLVFFDEINARLDGQYVYDTFLAPLEEGVYVRGGKTFHIDPCVWVFAGTERPVPSRESTRDKSEKASDFESRLSLEPLDLRVNLDKDGQEEEVRVENVYLGVCMLRAAFPDVRKVSKKVLQAFHTIPPRTDARELRHFVKSFTNIQYGEVRANNINRDRLKKLCGNIKNWSDQPEAEEMIEIKG